MFSTQQYLQNICNTYNIKFFPVAVFPWEYMSTCVVPGVMKEKYNFLVVWEKDGENIYLNFTKRTKLNAFILEDTKQAQPVHVPQFHSWGSNLPWPGQEVCAGGGRALEGEMSAMLLLRAYFSCSMACLPISCSRSQPGLCERHSAFSLCFAQVEVYLLTLIP